MSYIERIRGPQSVTVVPANGVRREITDGIHPYAEGIRRAWLTRLDDLAGRPWSHGDAWDTNCFQTARKLIELANSSWSGYGHSDARTDYFNHAPRDHVWDKREKCWDQASVVAASVALPEPAPNDSYVIPEPTILPAETTAPVGDEDASVDVGALIRERLPLLDFVHLMSTEDEGEEWIVEPILPARRLVALYSAPKVGKSLLMLEIAVGIALGVTVLGVTPTPRKVLYVDFENDPRGDVKRRLEAMGYGAGDGQRLNDGLCYLSFPTIAKLDTAQGGYELLTAAQEYGCEVVVIDTVSRAVGGEENDNDTWLAFYRDTGMRLKGAGIACIRLDHSGKDLEKGMRGGSAKYGDVDAVWKLSAASETVLELICTDHRMPIEEDRLTLVREVAPNLHHRVAGDRTVALDAKEKELDDALDRLGIDAGTSVRQAKAKLREHGITFKNPVLERVLRARRMRLPQASPAPSGDASPQSLRPSPRPVSLKGDREGTTPVPKGTPSDDDVVKPMFVVACRRCYVQIHRDQATSGLCPKCVRETGLAP